MPCLSRGSSTKIILPAAKRTRCSGLAREFRRREVVRVESKWHAENSPPQCVTSASLTLAGAHAFNVDCSQKITFKQEPSVSRFNNGRNVHTKLSRPFHIDQNKITTAPISCGIPRNPKPESKLTKRRTEGISQSDETQKLPSMKRHTIYHPPLTLRTFSFPPTLPAVILLTHRRIAHPLARAWKARTSLSSCCLRASKMPFQRIWITVAALTRRSLVCATTAHSCAIFIKVMRWLVFLRDR